MVSENIGCLKMWTAEKMGVWKEMVSGRIGVWKNGCLKSCLRILSEWNILLSDKVFEKIGCLLKKMNDLLTSSICFSAFYYNVKMYYFSELLTSDF